MTNSKQVDIYYIIGLNIKKYRKLKGFTQRSLSEALLLSESFIAKLESRTHQTISIDTLLLIADFLEVDIACFFDDNILNYRD
ncbi:MAG: helix-turn-helix transcriptional regulator [Bacilli bacterium]|nr:helix-turn-helix transcriptional regulator [Bacilli bacterium]